MSSEAFHLTTVEDVLVITGRKPVMLFPGLPRELPRRISVGDKIELRRPDGTCTSTIIAGIEHARMLDGKSQRPLRLPESIGVNDVPVGTEVWWISDSKS
jgi:hypothetical protein